jgi:anti-sigma regulatory factor (Ser/Thr protein kinase)
MAPGDNVAHRHEDVFAHTALIIGSDEDLRTGLVPQLRRSLGSGERVMMVVSEHTATVIRTELGPMSAGLEWGDQSAFYRRLGMAFEAFRRHLAQRHAAGSRVHVIAEPDLIRGHTVDTPVDRVAAYLSYEAMCNQVYAPYGSAVTCIWNRRHHTASILDGVRQVHNYALTASGRVPNLDYIRPVDYLAGAGHSASQTLPPHRDIELHLVNGGQLHLLHAVVRPWAAEHRFDARAADDVILAVSEVTTNGLVHGAVPVHVCGWHRGDTLIVQVDDAGGRPIPPTAGFCPPREDSSVGGRGLWLARQLADVVTVHTTAGRSTVRLYFPREVMHGDLE